jgi:hypothetical protein
VPVAWLTTAYGDPSAWAVYESVPPWLTWEDSGPSRTVARAVPASTLAGDPLPLSNGSVMAVTTPAAVTTTITMAAPTSSRLRRLGVRGSWRSGPGGSGVSTPGPGTLALVGVLIGHRP